jgi:tetratricopeptide (TPR) repeat protein
MTVDAGVHLEKAIQLHKAGDLDGAIQGYRTVLKEVPQHAGALNLLGLAFFQNGNAEQALPLLQQALTLRPDLPGGDYNLALALCALNRYAESVPHFERTLAINSRDVDAHLNLANALLALDKDVPAATHFEKAIALRPDCIPAHVNLGKLLLAKKNFTRAISHFNSTLALNPNLLEAHLGLVEALRGQKLVEESVAAAARAVGIAPNNAEARWRYGVVLHDARRFKESIEQHQNAIVLAPEHAKAHYSLGHSYYALNEYDLAEVYFRRAIALNVSPMDAIFAENMIALILHARGRYAETAQILDKHIAKYGDSPGGLEARKSKGMCYLNLGKFTEGWPLYRYRLGASAPDARETRSPRWNGEVIDGPLWVWGEQGLGDQILHASMIDDLRGRASSVVLEVEARLVSLFARSFPGIQVVPLGSDLSAQKFQAQTSIADLGCYFRPDWASFPKREKGYLVTDPERTAELRSRIASDGKKVIGVSWRSVSPRFGQNKSAQLDDFIRVFEMPGVCCVDLQYGDTGKERLALEQGAGISVTRVEDIDNTQDIDGLAALMCACDAVATVSNTTAHLAGALGRPTWVFVPYGFAQMWYWFEGKSQSPWYPRVEVRRQSEGQSWKDLISPAAEEIATLFATVK